MASSLLLMIVSFLSVAPSFQSSIETKPTLDFEARSRKLLGCSVLIRDKQRGGTSSCA